MSLPNLLISLALSVSPEELSAVQKAATKQEKHHNSSTSESSSTSQPRESESRARGNVSGDDKESKESRSEVPVYRPSEGEHERGEGGQGEGLPSYGAVEETIKPPAYEVSEGKGN